MAKKVSESFAGDGCFFCIMKEQDLTVRRAGVMNYFRNMITHNVLDDDDQELALVLSGLWSIAMGEPDSEEFPSLGIFEFTANLIEKCVSSSGKKDDYNKRNNICYIPYYAAHIIGSYTMNNAKLAVKAVDAGVIPPLLDLLRGKMSWVEQRVAVRALGHIASYESTFESLAMYEDEVVGLAMHLASTCVDVVYNTFVGVTDKNKRLKYHRDLLSRGVDDMDLENRKAEEWTSQLQCWCLHLLNCFAIKHRSLDLICKPEFFTALCGMWGLGLMSTSTSSPAGIGLLRILCYSKVGRRGMAESKQVLENLCNLSRSSDNWQYMGIDCLLLLLKDQDTRYKVMEITTPCLVDLIELNHLGGRSNFGEKIIKALLINNNKIKNREVQEALDKLCNYFRARKNRNLSNIEKAEQQRTLIKLIKQQASHRFRLGKIEEAVEKYTEAIDICPLRYRKERMVLYSNRGECHLLLRNPDAAISDTTRALCLSNPPNSHCKSLWVRSQAYDMKGLSKESLMDCINGCFKYSHQSLKQQQQVMMKKVPYYAIKMICKQMDSTWLFRGAQLKTLPKHPDPDDDGDGDDDDLSHMNQNLNINGVSVRSISTVNKCFMSGLSTTTMKWDPKLVQNGGSSRRRLGGKSTCARLSLQASPGTI